MSGVFHKNGRILVPVDTREGIPVEDMDGWDSVPICPRCLVEFLRLISTRLEEKLDEWLRESDTHSLSE